MIITNMISYAITITVNAVTRVELVMVIAMNTTILYLVATMTEETAMIKTNGLIVQTPI